MASKKEILMALSTMNLTEDVQVGETVVTPADIKDFAEAGLAQVEARAEAAKKKQAEKRAAGDALRAQIKSVLDETPKTITEIIMALNNVDITPAMVVARLTQLCKLNEVEKSEVKNGDRTVKAYSIAA